MNQKSSVYLSACLSILVGAVFSSAAPQYYNKPPVGDPNPNDIYKDLTHHEPQLDGNSRLLYKNLGILRYYIQDPEKADYLIVDKDSRVPNEVSNKDVAAAGPIGLPPAPRRQHSRPRNPQGLI